MVGCRTSSWPSPSSGSSRVALAYRPIRREPLTIVSFVVAWIAGELAFQNIVWQTGGHRGSSSPSALSMAGPGGSAWPGRGRSWVGLVGLGVAGRRAADVTAAALAEVRSDGVARPDRADRRRRGAAGGG